MTHMRTVPILEVCGSPHTADVVRDHVAALVAVECFGEFGEILKGAQYPVTHTLKMTGLCSTCV